MTDLFFDAALRGFAFLHSRHSPESYRNATQFAAIAAARLA